MQNREAEEIGDSDVVNELYAGLDEQHRNQVPWLFQRPTEAARNAEFFASILADEKATVRRRRIPAQGNCGATPESSRDMGKASRSYRHGPQRL